jgi:hypothetical protein
MFDSKRRAAESVDARAALEQLAQSSDGLEAERARSILRGLNGHPGAKGAAALACATIILSEPGGKTWTLQRLKAEIERRRGISISISRLSILLRNLPPPGAGHLPAAKVNLPWRTRAALPEVTRRSRYGVSIRRAPR